MIRDGLTMTKKRIRKGAKSFERMEYKENLLGSVVQAIQLAMITGKLEYFAHLRDPYALLLALSPIGVEKEVGSKQEYPILTAKEYVEAVLNKNVEKIWPKMTVEEQDWCNFWAKERQDFGPMLILKTCAQEWGLDVNNVLLTWKFQPDPTSVAFAVTAPRAKLEHVAPVVGVPYVMVVPSAEIGRMRFPICIDKFMSGYMHVQIHKSGDLFNVFEREEVVNEYLEQEQAINMLLPQRLEKELRAIPHSYVVEGWYLDGELIIWDVLCWNDIWLHERPLSERIKLLWHFQPYRNETLVLYSLRELPKDNQYVGRNLNEIYDPTSQTSHIFVGEPTILLKVGGRRGGGRKTYLNTADGKAVFEIPFYVEKEDRGDVVEVTRDGRVLKILPRETIVDTWIDVCIHLGIDVPIYEEWSGDRMLPKVRWIENGR